jgi:hypothetical protein
LRSQASIKQPAPQLQDRREQTNILLGNIHPIYLFSVNWNHPDYFKVYLRCFAANSKTSSNLFEGSEPETSTAFA